MNRNKAKSSSPSKSVAEVRRTARKKQTVNYKALQDVKIETIDSDSDSIEEVTPPPSKKNRKSPKAKKVVTEESDGPCGNCQNCRRPPCRECSHCKNGDSSNCIDRYCMNDAEGRNQRQAAREAYLLSIGARDQQQSKNDQVQEVYSDSDEDAHASGDTDLTVNEKIDQVMAKVMADQKEIKGAEKKEKELVKKQDKQKAKEVKNHDRKDKPRSMGIYGGSSKAAKSRRCGECEGCMRDDCGQCQACEDKPRFGGPGTKKKACIMRYCRMRKLEEDHAQSNFPLNSAEVLNNPARPSKKVKAADGNVGVKSEDIDIDDAILQD